MKRTIRLFFLYIPLGACLCGFSFMNSEPKIFADMFLEKSVDEAIGSYGGASPTPCYGFEKQQKTYGSVSCFVGPHNRFFAVGSKKIIHNKKAWRSFYNGVRGSPVDGMPQVREILAKDESEPTYIFKNGSKFEGLDVFDAVWLHKGKFARFTAVCPTQYSEGKPLKKFFKNCYANQLIVSFLEEKDIPESFKKHELDF